MKELLASLLTAAAVLVFVPLVWTRPSESHRETCDSAVRAFLSGERPSIQVWEVNGSSPELEDQAWRKISGLPLTERSDNTPTTKQP